MAGNQGNRGGNRQQGQQQQYSNNEQTSLQERLLFVLRGITAREEEISAVLPPDLPFLKFHATINQALRNNPDILKCTGVSIVNACVKSAYDGLRLDGKEAALVAHGVKVSKNPDRYEDRAQYFPMVRGLIKKILMSGQVIAMEADVIYANDEHRVTRGTNPEIHHAPLLVGERGLPIAYYSVATFKSGYKSTEIMTMADVMDVKKEAKTQFVWNRWGNEMGKKSVIRRHEKRLPSGRDMIDVEAREMFPQFDTTTAHPQLAAPAPAAAPPRPSRAAIADQSGTESGMAFDVGGYDDRRDPVVVDQGRDESHEQQQRQQDVPREQERQQDVGPVLPEDATAWMTWGADLEAAIAAATTPEDLDRAWKAAAPVLKHASKAIRDRLTAKATDRNTELALDDDAD